MKYHIVTFGCQLNRSDSERIASVLEKMGYKKSSKLEETDLIVVNICSVRQSAVDRIFGLSEKFKKLRANNYKLTLRQGHSAEPFGGEPLRAVEPLSRSPQGDDERSRTIKTILTGCVLKKDRIKFKKKFDLILDIKDLGNWPKLLSYDFNDRRKHNTDYKDYLKIKPKYESPFSALIPIMTGCNNFCSYCVVPYTRGREISRPVKEILLEIKDLIKGGLNPIRNEISNGAREIWLLGQNVNSYHSRIRTNLPQISRIKNKKISDISGKFVQISDVNFAKLLKMVNNISGNFWIRFTSPHPKDFSDELIKTMAKSKKVTPYLNLPAQSGDNEILKKMNRPYTIEKYKKIVKKIKAAFKKYREGLDKEISLSTDIIVGFPGETRKQFENTIKLFKEIKYDMAYIAKYSPRPGTAAAKLKDNVSLKEKERRYKILTKILKETAFKKNRKFIGKEIEVLVESKKNGFLLGKSRHYKTVKINLTPKTYHLKPNLIGQFVKVKILDALPWGLKGILK